jgi:quinol monooxygenase YgiN
MTFPKWKYPTNGGPGKVVDTAEEERALGAGWVDEPPVATDDRELTLIAHLVARPDKIAETAEFLLSLVDATRPEDGCIEYHLHQGNEDPTVFIFYESWKTRHHWDVHMGRPLVQAIASRAADLLAQTPRIELMTMISKRP